MVYPYPQVSQVYHHNIIIHRMLWIHLENHITIWHFLLTGYRIC